MSQSVRQPTTHDLMWLHAPSWERYGRRRPSLFVLVDYLDRTRDGYEATLRRGFEKRCSELGIRLVVVVGHAMAAQESQSEPHRRIFNYVGPESADGVILISSGLTAHGGQEALNRLIEGFGSIPVCSLGQAIPRLPSVICDNRAGMQAIVEHVILHHQRRHILYIDGISSNQDAIARRKVCREVMARHGLALNSSAIASGNFTIAEGATATRTLLDSNSQIDAVIAANDSMALGAIEVLRQRGLAVGRSLSVTGFDDTQAGRLVEPPLTTVRQPLSRMAESAVDLIVAQWLGWTVPPETRLSSELVLRKSCGCRGAWTAPSLHQPAQVQSTHQFFEMASESLCTELDNIMHQEPIEIPIRASDLVEAFRKELSDAPGTLEGRIQGLIEHLLQQQISSEVLLPLLTFLRTALPVNLATRLEPAWPYMFSNIASAAAIVQLTQRLQVEAMYFSLIDVSNKIISALDFDSLVHALATTLPKLLQRRVFVGLLTVPDGETLETLLNSDGSSFEKPFALRTISMNRFLPDSMCNSAENRTVFILPITNDAELIGHIALESLDEFFDYQLLRDYISTSLRVIALHSEVLNQVTLRERSVQERLATAERMRTLSVLSGGVAHDLNNALGSLVALTDVVIGEFDAACINHDDLHFDDARQDLLTIKSGATRAAETVKDLMTLGRRGNAPPRPTDVAKLIRATMDDLKLQLNAAQLARLNVDLPDAIRQECVVANEVKLVRAVGNLVRNAMDATLDDGHVKLHAEHRVLEKAEPGREVIPPGDYIVISVSDDGCGISEGQLGRVFEPFFTTKNGYASSGSGLGLAIVHGTVREHNGFLNVTSRIGIGTTFVMFLPRSANPAERRSSGPVRARGKAKILVVDDDPTQLRTARRVLQTAGYEVVTNASGDAALELIRTRVASRGNEGAARGDESPFDVIMLDMALNEQRTGLEILHLIREIVPRQRAILASGHGQLLEEMGPPTEDLVWLPKPYTTNALAKAIVQLLSAQAQ